MTILLSIYEFHIFLAAKSHNTFDIINCNLFVLTVIETISQIRTFQNAPLHYPFISCFAVKPVHYISTYSVYHSAFPNTMYICKFYCMYTTFEFLLCFVSIAGSPLVSYYCLII